jgi:hypothetical protein
VRQAADSQTASQHALSALSELCQIYWRPVHHGVIPVQARRASTQHRYKVTFSITVSAGNFTGRILPKVKRGVDQIATRDANSAQISCGRNS